MRRRFGRIGAKHVAMVVLAANCGGDRPNAKVAPPSLAHAAQREPDGRLGTELEPTRYAATLRAFQKTAFEGHIEITATLHHRSRAVWLHGVNLVIDSAAVVQSGHRGSLMPIPSARAGVIGLETDFDLVPGDVTIDVDYHGEVNTDPHGVFYRMLDGRAYWFTQSEAIDARRIFPCIDDPGSKVPWTITLEVDGDNTALSNAPMVNESDLGGGLKRVLFETTAPLPAYLIAVAVGPFASLSPHSAPVPAARPIRLLYPRGTAVEPAWIEDVSTIVSLLETQIGVAFPYPKLDVVAAPGLGIFMENAGLILVDAALVDGATGRDRAARVAWRAVLAHEIAHQWFGDLVTPAWWSDAWISESLAQFTAVRVLATIDGADPVDRLRARAVALARLRSLPSSVGRAVVDERDAWALVTGPVNERAATLLALLETNTGAESFSAGLRSFLLLHAHGGANANDLERSLASASGLDLSWAIPGLIDTVGSPEIQPELSCGTEGRITLDDPTGLLRGARICLAFGTDLERREACVIQSQQRTELSTGSECPSWVLPNAGGTNSFLTRWDVAGALAVARDGWRFLSLDEKVSLLEELAADGAPGPQAVVVLKSLDRETAPEVLTVAGRIALELRPRVPPGLRHAFDRWALRRFRSARRMRLAPNLESRWRPMLELLGLSGERRLQQDAAGLLTDYASLGPGARRTVLRLAAKAPRALERLKSELESATDSTLRRDLLIALSERGLGAVLGDRPNAQYRLRPSEWLAVLSDLCSDRDKTQIMRWAEEFGADAAIQTETIYRTCSQENSALAPQFDGWLGLRE